MEGLIPYVYRAIRRRRTRRYYKCLSSGSTRMLVSPSFHDKGNPSFFTPPPQTPAEAAGVFREEEAGHRRHKSMDVFPGRPSPEGFPEHRRLGKGSSLRSSRMLACIAGG